MTTPEFRRDPLHNTWVVFSPERQRRPQDFSPAVLKTGTLDPFAEGHERLTPPEVHALREPKTKPNEPGWRVRVVPNRYPAMRIEGALESSPVALYDRLTGIGAHEVIIETPDGELALEDLPVTAIAEVLGVYRDRMVDLDQGPALPACLRFQECRPQRGRFRSRMRPFATGRAAARSAVRRRQAGPRPRAFRPQTAQPL